MEFEFEFITLDKAGKKSKMALQFSGGHTM